MTKSILRALAVALILFAGVTPSFAQDVWGRGSPDGDTFGQSGKKLSFYQATPIVKPTDASQVAITDSTTGTVSNTFAAGVGVYTLSIPVHNLATVADGDVITGLVIGHKFKILAFDAHVTNEVTTAAKLSTLNLEIGTTDLTGGAIALTSANSATLGAKVAGSAITAANTGSAGAAISVEASSTTAFSEGGVMLSITIQNMDTADAAASTADKWNEVRSSLVALGLWTGS